MSQLHLSTSAAIDANAFDAFGRHFRSVKGMAAVLDWWKAHRGHRQFFVEETPSGLPIRNKMAESADRMFAHLHTVAQALYAAKFHWSVALYARARLRNIISYLF